MRNARAVALAAHDILGADAAVLYPQLLNKRSQFVYVARFADPAKAELLLRRNLAGVGAYSEERRTYPQKSVAAQVIGYAGVDNKGLEGLEAGYDSKLSGKPGSQTIVRDPFGRALEVVGSTSEVEGRDVFTTLDHTIQANAEQVLRQTVAKWAHAAATAIVLDPSTGEVLAMAQAPGYDATTLAPQPNLTSNRAVTDTYEPGSTFSSSL
jgi:cell division protein FtsI (penicillin-binding protein 3)